MRRIGTDLSFVAEIQDLKPQRNEAGLTLILGLGNLYCRLVRIFASIAALLNDNLKTSDPKDPQNCYAQEAKRFIDTTGQANIITSTQLDMQQRTVGTWPGCVPLANRCVWMQEPPDETKKPLSLCLWMLSAVDQNYDTTYWNCLAIVWAV